MNSTFRQHDSSLPVRHLVLAVLLVFGIFLSFAAHAAMPLDDWRNEIAALRVKAENDSPQAYLEAQLLQKEIPAGATLADRARMLNLLSRIELHLALLPESVRHSAEAKAIARQANDADGQIEADLNIALGAINQGRLDDMIAATQNGMSLLETVQRDDLRAEMMFQAAMMYLRFGQLEETITVAMQALEVANNSGNPRARAYAEQSMGLAYIQSGRHSDAQGHYRNMLEAARQAHQTLLEAAALLGLSIAADGMGDRKEAERLVDQAIKLFRRVGAPFYVSHAQHLLADIYVGSKQPEKALPLFDDNAKIYEAHENPIGLWWTLQARSHASQALGRLDKALGDAERAYALARKTGFNVYMGGSAQRLADVIAAQGDYKGAYRWSAEAAALKEKSDLEKSGKRVLDLAKRFREESKQRRIDELNHHNERQHAQQRQMQIGLAAVVSLLAITMFFLLRLRKSREEIRALNIGLEQHVLERTAELFDSQQSLAEAQRIAHVGSWENNLVDNVLSWSDETFRIFEIGPQHFGASYEAFMESVHPDDREMLDSAFKVSLENREPYEIEHRLLLSDGRIKYVHEHCETSYDADGRPLRSIGTVQDITERKEMENALRESRQLMAEAQRIARVGSWEYDIANDSHNWSDELFRIYEIDPVDKGASYEGCMNVTHLDDREEIARLYLDAVKTGQPYESEHRLLMADGRIKYVHERCEMICGPDGTLLRAVGMMQDITERKQAEQRLTQALEFSEGIINAIPDLLFEMDRNGRYLNVWTQNPELLVAQKEMLLGKTVGEVLSPENAVIAMEAIHEADENGVATGKVMRIDLPQGTGWFEHSLAKKSAQTPDDATFMVLSRDITERKQLENALAAREQEFRSLAESSPDFIVRYDHEGRHAYLNNNLLSKLGLADMDEVLGKRPAEVWADGRFSAIEEAAVRAVESGEMQQLEMTAPNEKGGLRYTQISVVPERGASGDIIGTIAFGRDITAIRETERKLSHFIDNLPGMAFMFRLSPDGVLGYTYLSHTAEEIYGLTAEQVKADLQATYPLVPPEDRERIGAAIAESARNLTPKLVDFRVCQPGKPERWFETRSLPERQADGSTLWFGIMLDITERKQTEQRLKEALEFNEGVINAIPDLLFEMDKDGRYLNLWTHTPELLAEQKEVLLGNTVRDMLAPESAAVIMEALREAGEKGVSFGKVLHIDLPEGTHWFELSVSMKPGSTPSDGTFMVLSRDITKRRQMEEKLAVREQEFRALAENSPDTIARYIHGGIRTYINPLFARLAGKPAHEMLGVTAVDYQATPQALVYHNALLHSLESGEEGECEYIWPTFDGELITSHIRIVPEFGADGKVASVLAVGRDITERKRTENDLRTSEERMRLFFERQLIGAAITSPQKGWMQVNDKVCEMLGYSREELVRLTWAELTYPDDLAADTAQFERLLSGEIEGYTLEKRFVRKDGRIVFTNLAVGCVRQADRTVEYVLALLDDITERKRMEAELRASRNFLDTVIESVSDPIFVKDKQHRWTLLNDACCAFSGYTREMLIGKSDYDIFSKEQADEFWEKDQLVFDSGEVNLNEECFTTASGEVHYIQTKKTPFISADGQQMLVGVIRDITDLKRYEVAREAALAEAQRLAKLRSEFIAHMSHELRTPLNGILGYAQMLGRDGKLDEKQQASMDVIHQSGEHLLALIDDILDLARIESGKLELDMSDIPLARFLNVVAGIVGVRAKQKQLEFVCEFASDLPEGIRGDEKRLRQVLLNLLSNAVKFTDRGKVTLSVSRIAPSRLAFTVTDTGIGIAQTERETIFQSFEQVSDVQHRQGGTGLGLSISRQLVRLMGGDIAVESRPGEGSIFRFELNLPEIEIKPQLLTALSDDTQQAESEYAVEPVQSLVAPSQDEIRELHRLALLGNMRDIANYAERMTSLDTRYRPFAEHLKRLANSYQSKAIMAFVEEHLLQQDTLGGDTDAKQGSTIDPDKGDVI